jgi:hypothetical protein
MRESEVDGIHLAETRRTGGWSNPPLQLTNAPTIVIAS